MAGKAQRIGSQQSAVSSRQSSVSSRQSKSESRAPRPEPRAQGPEASATSLDRIIHERMRLAIVSALAVNDSLTFNDLKRLLETTDGNLSVHARKLEEAGYVTCEKYFDGRTPKTEYRLTAPGRRALERYLDHMEAIIHATRDG
jgi:DNA-binding transcriptional ArsR family regulator